ncbi:hypothetical protein R3P38DRAFT_2772281 [Favolaschia claudopus]|uniref:Uncharacterized protein n=1 Tax=Favolaschia claudopus TaxID=2862362 RepID=A0AAW0C6D9_9AGAR
MGTRMTVWDAYTPRTSIRVLPSKAWECEDSLQLDCVQPDAALARQVLPSRLSELSPAAGRTYSGESEHGLKEVKERDRFFRETVTIRKKPFGTHVPARMIAELDLAVENLSAAKRRYLNIELQPEYYDTCPGAVTAGRLQPGCGQSAVRVGREQKAAQVSGTITEKKPHRSPATYYGNENDCLFQFAYFRVKPGTERIPDIAQQAASNPAAQY